MYFNSNISKGTYKTPKKLTELNCPVGITSFAAAEFEKSCFLLVACGDSMLYTMLNMCLTSSSTHRQVYSKIKALNPRFSYNFWLQKLVKEFSWRHTSKYNAILEAKAVLYVCFKMQFKKAKSQTFVSIQTTLLPAEQRTK